MTRTADATLKTHTVTTPMAAESISPPGSSTSTVISAAARTRPAKLTVRPAVEAAAAAARAASPGPAPSRRSSRKRETISRE
jgi:hypothetical protein